MPKDEEKRGKKEGNQPASPQKKRCFLICPIGDPGSIEWRRSGQLEEFILKPALGDEYDIKRADKIPDPGMIPPQIVERLIDDDLVIADLTDRNPNVFYELAVRHAIQKPVIHLMEETQLRAKKIPFDNAPMRTIPYPGDFDSDKTKDCRMQIREAVRAAVANPEKLHSPISIAKIDKIILDLKSSGGSRDEVVGQIFEMLKEMQARLSSQYPVFQQVEWTPPGINFNLPYAEPTVARISDSFTRSLLNAINLTKTMFNELTAAEETTDRNKCFLILREVIHKTARLSDVLQYLKAAATSRAKREDAFSALSQIAQIRESLSSAQQTSNPQKRRGAITQAKDLVTNIRGILEIWLYYIQS